jgi:D-3-phosphoglycerate dehydrogenase
MIAICSRSVSRSEEAKKLLKKKFKKIKINNSKKNLKGPKLINFIKNSEAIIVGVERIDKELLDQCTKLKVIGKYGVGTNNIDFDELKKRKIKILLQPGINKRAVSELTLSLIILGLRNVYHFINDVKKSKWPFLFGKQLFGKKIGIVGCGSIGRDLIKLLKPLKCKILTHDIEPDTKYLKKNNLRNYTLNYVLKKSDIITLHIPYNKKSMMLLSKKEICKLRKEVILINTSRGGIVDENSFYEFLKKNKQATGIFDVMENEPPVRNKLIKLKNFLLTPHIAGSTYEAIKNASVDCVYKILDHYKEFNKKNKISKI